MSALVAPLETLRLQVPHNSKRLNVLILTPFYPSLQDPAQGCFIAEPVRRMSHHGIESHVLAVNPFYRRPYQTCGAESEWKRYYALPGNVGLVTSGLVLARTLRRRIRELHRESPIDLIHAHAALPCGEAAVLLAAELQVPCVVTVHGLDVFADRQCGRWLGTWARRLSLRAYHRSQTIICISKKVQQHLPRDLHRKTRIVYNGVDATMFSPSPEQTFPPRILSVGNLIPTKDHGLLLRAFTRLRGPCPDAELEIIGDGPERARLEQLARSLGVSSRVTLRGRQGRQSVALAMKNCAVFVLPSRYEGLGCVYLEAMACAKPVVACTGQGIDEIVQDGCNGVLVRPGDENSLTTRLLQLLQDSPLRRQLGAAARETVLRRHTLDHQSHELSDIYRECIA